MSKTELNVRPIAGPEDWEKARVIRTAVFIEEQSCPPAEEWDGQDETSRHLVAWMGNRAVGVARWRAVPHDGRIVAKLERFAVLKEHRRLGYGRSLVHETIEDARRAGFSEFLIHAQQYLERYYSSLGFVRFGEAFMEVGIPHVRMILKADSESGGRNMPE